MGNDLVSRDSALFWAYPMIKNAFIIKASIHRTKTTFAQFYFVHQRSHSNMKFWDPLVNVDCKTSPIYGSVAGKLCSAFDHNKLLQFLHAVPIDFLYWFTINAFKRFYQYKIHHEMDAIHSFCSVAKSRVKCTGSEKRCWGERRGEDTRKKGTKIICRVAEGMWGQIYKDIKLKTNERLITLTPARSYQTCA